ncbi:uncharacterized protein [Amphiura filiformis]|uniref:uncharacterized protein n=1 Tax=Amphiura filiformis TaxID=82378 RepID=UPI003B215E35
MNLFKDLRENYGRNAVRDLRSLENTERKISRFRCHRVFSLRAKHSGLIPTSLKLKCPINSVRARDIVKKAEKALLNERIRVISNKIRYLEQEKTRLNTDLKSRDVNKELSIQISRHVENSRENELQYVRARQTRKLKELAEKQDKSANNNANKNNSHAEPDLSGTQLKRWVKNLSKYKLSDAQNRVLARGLGYGVSPDNLTHSSIVDEHIVACERACWKLPKPEAAQLRAEIVGTLKSAKLPPSNIGKDERVAINQLQKEESIMVLGADKGRATVVMDKTEYQQKMSTLLSDSKTYEKLDRDPTPKHKRELVSILQRLEKEEKIKKADKQFLYPTSENVPRIYGSPKIHKDGTPLRPIVDFTGSIGYNVAKSLADILSPIVGQSEHHVLNSKSLAEDLKDVTLEDDEILNSHDVVALFTSTPIDLTLHILKERLNEDKDLKIELSSLLMT